MKTLKKKVAQTFIEMYNFDWKTSVSSKALSTLAKAKYNKTQLLPLVEDVVTLNTYIERSLQKPWSDEFCGEFNKLCLVNVILLNMK